MPFIQEDSMEEERNNNLKNGAPDGSQKASGESDSLYSDYPKEVVQLLMNSNPLKNMRKFSEEEINNSIEERLSRTRIEKEELFGSTRMSYDREVEGTERRKKEHSPEKYEDDNLNSEQPEDINEKENIRKDDKKTELKKAKIITDQNSDLEENAVHQEKFNTTEAVVPEDLDSILDESDDFDYKPADNDFDDIAQAAKKQKKVKNFDEDDEEDDIQEVQVIRHKSRKKEFKRNFPVSNEPIKPVPEVKTYEQKTEFEDIEDKISDESKERKKRAVLDARKKQHMARHGELEARKQKNKNNSELEEFFDGPRKTISRSSGRKSAVDKGMVIVCVVVLFVFVFLFVRNLTLSARVEEAEKQLADYTQLQQTNEELKLEIVSLQEKLTQNGISLTDDTAQSGGESANTGDTGTTATDGQTQNENTDTQSSNETYDTYTVVAGDTLSGISDKVYGNYSGYIRILEANGLTEDSNLQIGQVLRIPRD